MKKIVSASQMQICDIRTINENKIPSLVLMERAALKVVETISNTFPDAKKFAVVCGPGNNGGDGVAVARLLYLSGKEISLSVLGNSQKYSKQLQQEIAIAESYGLTIDDHLEESSVENADVTIDAMFGIGLTRGLAGDFAKAATIINKCANKVLAVDIPSGYNADSGKLLGENGVKADVTVTFAYIKKGLLLGDCKAATGQLITADVGIYLREKDKWDTLVEDDIFDNVAKRQVDANKGSCGKLLVIAGSEDIYGACYLSAKSALVSGAGLVKIYTHNKNVESIRQNLPEAMFLGYDSYNENEVSKQITWASTILIGPGLGQSELSKAILKHVLKEATCPIVIDADGLNLISDEETKNLFKEAAKRVQVVITPHLKEMERLTGINVVDINYNMQQVAEDFAKETGCIVVLKNFTTIVSDGNQSWFITSGNEALATPGSGDVLAGAIASLIGQKVNEQSNVAVCVGAYLHGAAGTKASNKYGIRGLLASQIIEEFKTVVKL